MRIINNPIWVAPGKAQLAVYKNHIKNLSAIETKRGSPSEQSDNSIQKKITTLCLATLCPNSKVLADALTGSKGPCRSWTEWSPKLLACLEIIRDCLYQGEQVIVGSPFPEFSSILQEKLEEAEVPFTLIQGATSYKKRAHHDEPFEKKACPVLIVEINAISEGQKFHDFSHIILPSICLDYSKLINSISPLNDSATPTIYSIVMRGSIDEHLHKIHLEPEGNVEPEHMLLEAIQASKYNQYTVDEQDLIIQWESTLSRQLRHAAFQSIEHKKIDAGVNEEEMQEAITATKLPSPTQLTVDICRKKFKEGITEFPSRQKIIQLTAALAAKNKEAKRKEK